MRQRSGRSSGHFQDLTEQIIKLIHTLEASKTPCTRRALIKELSTQCNISVERAENSLEGSIRQGRVIELYTANQLVCHDVLRLKIRRNLRLSSNYDLSSTVRSVLIERGSRSSQDARSISEIHDHIMATYNLQENSVENLSNCLDKAIKLLLKRNQIETKVPLNDNEPRYFLTSINSSIVAPNNSIMMNIKPSTSTASPLINTSPNHKTKRREKRISESSNHHATDSSNKSELKSLQDSLSAFFTPTNVRRSRVAQSSFSLEALNVRSPLEIVINNGETRKLKKQHSDEIHSFDSSKHSSPSPNNRRADKDKLLDSLSPYFSANNERRRKHEKGEYLQLCNGGNIPKKKLRNSMLNSETDSLLASVERQNHHSDFFDDELSSDSDNETLRTSNKAVFDSTVDSAVENESVIELEVARASSPNISNKKNRTSSRIIDSLKKQTRSSQHQIKPSSLRRFKSRKSREKSAISRVSSNLLKRARQQCHARLASVHNQSTLNRRGSSVLPMTPKKLRTEVPASSTIITNNLKNTPIVLSSPMRRTSFSPVKAFNLSSSTSKIGDETPVKVEKADESIYHKTRQIIQKRMDDNSRLMYEKSEEGIFPAKIRIGKFEINTWYSSPYPQEYACLPLLYICERCLMYMCNNSHHEKCKLKYPPGNEIYRSNNLSVFEVDGNLARVYCRNLCLLAKLFMDHKTLYFDVEPFLFYILTVTDEHGCHFVGYFSKEKYSHQQFNLACIVALPCYQRSGYGRFLIDFSYLLSRREKMLGTPERPLSEMGKLAYNSYWRTAIFEYIYQRREERELDTLSALEIAKATGIAVHDVVDVLKDLGFLSPSNGDLIAKNQNLIWTIDWDAINKHWIAAKKSDRRIWLDETKLNWVPKVYTPNTDFFLRSPLRSPLFSHNGSPHKVHTFGSRKTNQKNSTRFRIPIDQKSPKKQQNRHQKNAKAAVFEDVKDDGFQSNDSSKNGQVSTVNLTRSFKEENLSDSDTNCLQFANSQLASGTAASKSHPRKSNHSYMSCASNSSSDEDGNETIINRTNFMTRNSNANSPNNFRLSGGIGRKKLPAEVERAQQRSQQPQDQPKRRQLQKTPSISSVDSSDEDPDFAKRVPNRRSTGGKKKVPTKKTSGKSTKTINDENNALKTTSRSRNASRRSSGAKKSVNKKKSSPKQLKSISESPTLNTKKMDDENASNNDDENTDEDDEPYRSSASPPSLSKRTTRHSILHRSSLNQIVETVNMGGDSDFVNLGGDPEDESQPSYTHSQTPKAPKPHANLDEDEENDVSTTKQTHMAIFNSQIPPSIEQHGWDEHKQTNEDYTPIDYANSSTNFVSGSNFQQTNVNFNTDMGTTQNNTHVEFIMHPASPEQSTEMPILKHQNVEDRMPTLNEEDDAPPELSPMPVLIDNSNIDNDGPDLIEPPKLEDSTIPVTTSSNISKTISFDSFVDQKSALLRKKSMPVSMISSDDRFEGTQMAISQIQQHQSPLPPTIHHTTQFNANSHPPQSQIFSPQNAAVHTPSSLQPQSHASNSTASESGLNLNVSDIMSPNNMQKPVEHLLPPYSNIQQQVYSPAKPSPLVHTKSSTSRKDKQPRHPNAATRRRNTTDGSELKHMVPSEQATLDPKFAQHPNAALNGMFLQHQFMNPYLMSNPMTNNQFNAIAQQSAYNNYDYASAASQHPGYPALYGGNFYPPYHSTVDGLNSMTPHHFSAFYPFQQNQQMLQAPQLPPNFNQITNTTGISSNPAASLVNNGTASIYYNRFS